MSEDQKKYQNNTHSNKTQSINIRDFDSQVWAVSRSLAIRLGIKNMAEYTKRALVEFNKENESKLLFK